MLNAVPRKGLEKIIVLTADSRHSREARYAYLGYTGKAVAQLLITVLTCGLGAFISSIWSFIEGIMILTGNINTDADGRRLSD